MPTQKIFKQRIRARMTKTGESYTAARHQLLRKAVGPDSEAPTLVAVDDEAAVASGSPDAIRAAQLADEAVPADAMSVSDDAMLRATGRRHAEWFALLDAWGGTQHGHSEIARWLGETQGVPPWWTQSVTVAYERARGMRGRHEMRNGFSVGATRTVDAAAERALQAFTDAATRRRWLPDAPVRQRPTRAALTARFDWAEPPSRVVVIVVPKGDGRSTVSVSHEQLPDADVAERMKAAWRQSLGRLKTELEAG